MYPLKSDITFENKKKSKSECFCWSLEKTIHFYVFLFKIHFGTLRLFFSTSDDWSWLVVPRHSTESNSFGYSPSAMLWPVTGAVCKPSGANTSSSWLREVDARSCVLRYYKISKHHIYLSVCSQGKTSVTVENLVGGDSVWMASFAREIYWLKGLVNWPVW